jgi:hypothetical protein
MDPRYPARPYGATDDGEVRVCVPCAARFARVARTAAAACGVLEGFSVEALGDIRLLVDEIFVAMYELGAADVELRLTPGHGRLAVAMECVGPLGGPRGVADVTFARALAGVVASDVRFDLAGTPPSFSAQLIAG